MRGSNVWATGVRILETRAVRLISTLGPRQARKLLAKATRHLRTPGFRAAQIPIRTPEMGILMQITSDPYENKNKLPHNRMQPSGLKRLCRDRTVHVESTTGNESIEWGTDRQ